MAAIKISKVLAVALMFGSCLSSLSAQAPSAAPACIERLVIPQYPISARSAGMSATVDVVDIPSVLERWAPTRRVAFVFTNRADPKGGP